MDELEKKIKAIKDQIEWAKEKIEKPEYENDSESISFFKGIIYLEKFLED